MSGVVWKGFRLDKLFVFNSENDVKKAQKDMEISKIKNDEFSVALVTAGGRNNGVVGYLSSDDYIGINPSKNSYTITFNSLTPDEAGLCLYHNYNYVTQTAKTFYFIDPKLNSVDFIVHKFIACILSKIFLKTHFFGYMYKLDNDYKFPREFILLPCIETTGDDYIWDMDGKKWTLAVEYIKQLMQEAKELREEKTIKRYEEERKRYEEERKRYEEERKRYEEEYLKQKEKVFWKGFKLDELFEFSSEHSIKSQIKNLTVFDNYEEGTVANVTASKENNGIVGYIEETEEIKRNKVKNILTIASDAAYAGVCFYQDDYVVTTGHNKMIGAKKQKFKELLNDNKIIWYFLSKMLTKIFCKTFYGFSKSITDTDFNKNIILLPCIETTGDDYIWDMDGKKWTLAVEYISYIYLTGRINQSQKLIDSYTYQY